ncbi:hypothetical protein BAUCODRAFT_37619 [Baudoinia panamericana UAMH 10762]|uniref:DUF7820 domain-containing protein n=1 Tax=Baudoinia panamericana (strain UAMH 10762) TaxID=717646 RepID=M2N1A9_BAUPA|nr:uncharacterized protein BAUCODRAFT_37619 [Baudoinia panamericana UAMH 10762]EMC92719.1 hypothetical protein BAUCODRAFT_37619 [Baudoinia panamericana UAMH 10762]
MERRSLLDGEATPTHENPNVFDDEFEVEDFDVPVDGYRPPQDTESEGRPSIESPPVRIVSAHYAASPVSPISRQSSHATARNSMRKSRAGAENPFASPEDDGYEHAPRLTFEPENVRRSVSSTSSRQFAGSSTPRLGAGPSHPYGAYPQGTLPRTPSMATQSTLRAPRGQSAAAQNGPQHPYALYPQGVAEDDDEELTEASPIPVGFTGLGQTYHRRRGPEGEEQDIIGEDGHTEQLPPYTRYPEDAPEKMPLLVPEAPRALHSRAPVAGSDPTMSLMHTPIQPSQTPQPQSMTDESNLRAGRPASIASAEARNDSFVTDSSTSKSWKEKTWKERRKTKLCGVPLGWVLLVVGVAVFMVIVISAVIGGFLNHQKNEQKQILTSGGTSLYDASAIPTPVSAAPPTGTYALSLSTPQEAQAACLVQSNQQAAWACNLAGNPAAVLTVVRPPNVNQTGAYMSYSSSDKTISYGSQNYMMQTLWAPFMTVQDNDAPGDGPAYYFQQFYDKVVVVPESALTAPTAAPGSNTKRQALDLAPGWLQQKQVASAGEKPWFCVWNNTFMEGFIYVQQPIASTYSLATPTPTPTNISSPVTKSPATTAPITAKVTLPSTTITWTGPPSAYASWATHLAQYQTQGGYDYDGYDGNDGNNNHKEKRQYDPDALYDSLSVYPKVVKIEERRLPGNTVQPYCQQYQILDDGGYGLLTYPGTSQVIAIQLDEVDPGYGAYQSAGVAGSRRKQMLGERATVPGTCHCQWMSGQSGQ